MCDGLTPVVAEAQTTRMEERDARRALRGMLAVYLAAAVFAAVQVHLAGNDNNWSIFRNAFQNLLAGRDLYAFYPAVHTDRFKYSPTFALLIGPLAVLPVVIGMALWNAINAAALWSAVTRLLPPRTALLSLLIILPEMFGSMQRQQSNALVTAFVIFAFLAFESEQPARGALAIAGGTIIKIFPLAAVSLAIFHPRRVRVGFALVLSLAALMLLPLVVTSPHELAAQYQSWRAIERMDALGGTVPGDRYLIGGVMQQLRLWAGVQWPNWPVQLAGTVLLLLPLALRRPSWTEAAFRMRYLASLLIYMVIFNHQAEAPSFVIAMTGIALWYTLSRRAPLDTALLALALLLVSVAPSSLTPHDLRAGVVLHYGVKSIPCIVIWLVLQAELLGLRGGSDPAEVRELDPTERLEHGR